MNLREAIKAEISPAANRRRVDLFRRQEGRSGSYVAAMFKSSAKAKKLAAERRAAG